jgi:hypothetical protein
MPRYLVALALLLSSHPVLQAQLTGVSGMLRMMTHFRAPVPSENTARSDTLVIGFPPNDSLTVTGSWTHQGPVLVVGNGVLRFKHADATIIGDLWVIGDHATVTADSSRLWFPQAYFYQRALVAAGNAHIEYHHVTMDHSGLSHSIAVFDSASVKFSDVTDVGFTTWGTGRKPTIEIDHINTAGEFVITDSVTLRFSHVNTLLLWHQVPAGASMDISFPEGDTLASYTLDGTTPGVSGIGYTIRVDTSTNVMWALMPSTGSDVSVSGSKLRSIGLWFKGHDTLSVTGLVNNNEYADYFAPLSDRTLHLVNTSVQTWSLYPMDTTHLDVTGCIVGEIGTQQRSTVTTTGIYVDGSGGYTWATDTTLLFVINSTAVNDIRSDKSAIFIFGYSTLNSGIASAHGNSILMLIQSQIPEAPQLWDGACLWEAKIAGPSAAFVDTLVPVQGTARIDKTPSSHLMDFAWYRMYWKKNEDTLWQPAGEKIYNETHDDLLFDWDTHGLAPGLYNLRLLMCDNTVDSNQVEAVKGVSLLPKILGIGEPGLTPSVVYPNPVTAASVISFTAPEEGPVELTVTDLAGRTVIKCEVRGARCGNRIPLYSEGLSAGIYYYFLKSRTWRTYGSFLVK